MRTKCLQIKKQVGRALTFHKRPVVPRSVLIKTKVGDRSSELSWVKVLLSWG